jgi:hypothetical protein
MGCIRIVVVTTSFWKGWYVPMRYVEDGFTSGKRLTTMLLLVLVLCGVVFGVCLVWHYPHWNLLRTEYATQGFLESTTKRTLLDVYTNALAWTSSALLIVYLCGYSAIGHALSLAVVFMRGVALGLTISATYVDYSSKGILVVVTMVVFHAVVTTLALVFATIDSIHQSTAVACSMLGRTSGRVVLRRYNLKFVKYAVVVVLSSAVDTLLTYLLCDRLLPI